MEFGPPEFHSLAEAIVYQQLNGKAAVTIFKRFAALAGEPITAEGILKLSRRAVEERRTVEAEVGVSERPGGKNSGRTPRLFAIAGNAGR